MKPVLWKGQSVKWVQPKYDGWHCLWENGNFWTARKKLPRYLPLNLPKNTILEGELIAPGKPASEISTILKNAGYLAFIPFAMPRYNGLDSRTWEMLTVQATLIRHHISFAETTAYVGQNRNELLAQAREFGLEGYVLKEHHYCGWYKLKVEHTADCTVLGFKPGRGKYTGMVGALIVSINGKEVASVGGMTDEIRAEITEADIGRLCEVKYQNRTSHGRLRHPRFVRWRDDKTRESYE